MYKYFKMHLKNCINIKFKKYVTNNVSKYFLSNLE